MAAAADGVFPSFGRGENVKNVWPGLRSMASIPQWRNRESRAQTLTYLVALSAGSYHDAMLCYALLCTVQDAKNHGKQLHLPLSHIGSQPVVRNAPCCVHTHGAKTTATALSGGNQRRKGFFSSALSRPPPSFFSSPTTTTRQKRRPFLVPPARAFAYTISPGLSRTLQ